MTSISQNSTVEGNSIRADGARDWIASIQDSDDMAVLTSLKPFFDIPTLNGMNGFAINSAVGQGAGRSVDSAGDVNGDGISDFIINESLRSRSNNRPFGQSYIVFGSTEFLPTLNLFTANGSSTLSGFNGFTIKGTTIDAAQEDSRFSQIISKGAGDVNGDGIDDLIVAELRFNSVFDPVSANSYVVFGRSTGLPATINLSALNGNNGFAITDAADNLTGASISGAGDVNGDAIDDLIIGAPLADQLGVDAGQSYVVFGRATGFQPTLDLRTLNQFNGYALLGSKAGDRLGTSVSGAGDINGDGIDDLLVGASVADANGNEDAGKSYVVFGGRGPRRAALDISLYADRFGFVINGIASNDRSGTDLSNAGDVNGDGIDDLILSAPYAHVDGNENSGQSYIIFGSQAGFSSNLDLSTLNGTNGFAINGIAAGDVSGASVSGVGDVNGDSIDDLIIGAPNADANGNKNSGQSYVLFGSKMGFPASLNFSILNGANGFVINGIDKDNYLGFSVSGAGDVNGDGVNDVIISAPNANVNGVPSVGQSYVIFGKRMANVTTRRTFSQNFSESQSCSRAIQIQSAGATAKCHLNLLDRSNELEILTSSQASSSIENALTRNALRDCLW